MHEALAEIVKTHLLGDKYPDLNLRFSEKHMIETNLRLSDGSVDTLRSDALIATYIDCDLPAKGLHTHITSILAHPDIPLGTISGQQVYTLIFILE